MPIPEPIGRPVWGGLLLAAIVVGGLGCEGGIDGYNVRDRQVDAGAYRPGFVTVDRLREDFDNRRLIESITSAVLDVNRGALTLNAEHVPKLDGEGEERIDGMMQRNGLLEAQKIVVSPTGSVVASDSVELRAAKTVSIGGDVRIGPGGMTIVATERIEILSTAVIDSRGPIRLMIADEDGAIVIDGLLLARATAEGSANIEILGRGSVTVRGQIRTEADVGQTGGDITLSVYNDIRLEGSKASIYATANARATAGTVRVRTNSEVRLLEGAAIGRDPNEPAPIDAERDGAIEVQGGSIILDDRSRISSGDSKVGAAIDLLARDLIRAGEGARLVAGNGQVGGRLTLKAARIELGVSAVVAAGDGLTLAGNVFIDAIESLALEAAAEIRAGSGGCARGGDVRINVSGTVTVSAPAVIAAGNGATEFENHSCARMESGGNIDVVAHQLVGVEDATRAGFGEPDGAIDVRVDRQLSIAAVNLAVRTGGVVLSIPFERSAAAVGLIPRTIDLATDTPEGTSVTVELSGAAAFDDPYAQWFPIGSDDPDELLPLAGARWFRYRVTLEGRAFDAPLVDFFDIDLAPKY